jgi:tetratricopeptide (TPR) repeat protein
MYDRAETILAQALEVHERVGTPTRAWARDLERFADAGRLSFPPDSLLSLRRRALEIAELAAGPDDPLLADLLVALALQKDLLAVSDPAEYAGLAPDVVPELDRAIEILRAHPGDVRRELAFALNTRAFKSGEAERLALLREALDLRLDVLGPDHTVVAGSMNDLSLALEDTDPEAADSLMRRAAETYGRVLGPEHPETLTIWNNFAGLRRDRGDFAGAAEIYERVLDIRRRRYPELELPIGYSTYGLGVALVGLGEHDRAISLLRETLHLVRDRPVLQQVTRQALARALAAVGRYPEAESELRIAWAWWRDAGDDANAIATRDQLIELYEEWGRPERARAVRSGAPPGMLEPPD